MNRDSTYYEYALTDDSYEGVGHGWLQGHIGTLERAQAEVRHYPTARYIIEYTDIDGGFAPSGRRWRVNTAMGEPES